MLTSITSPVTMDISLYCPLPAVRRLQVLQSATVVPVRWGRGSGSGHFTINSGQVTVDQLRVKMTNTSQTITYIETFIPVNYYFEGDPEISVNPTAINVSMPTWDIWRGSFNIYNTGNGWLYYDMRDREDTDMDITREGISSTCPQLTVNLRIKTAAIFPRIRQVHLTTNSTGR